jgi:hypothetical protein
LSRTFVVGVGLCVPGQGDAAGWSTAFPGVPICQPTAVILPPALGRRASSLARMAATVAEQAARQGSVDLSRVPLVLGSAHGEIASAVAMMREFRGPTGLPSPTRFHNSVHNAAAAYLSIATGNRGFSTAVAAGMATPALAILEAQALLEECGGDVLVVLLDEPPPEPFEPVAPYPAAAAAICLSSGPGPRTIAAMSGPRRGPARRADLPGGLDRHPCGGAFALLRAIASRHVETVGLGTDGGGAWVIDVAPAA